jgi:hypothetical protein
MASALPGPAWAEPLPLVSPARARRLPVPFSTTRGQLANGTFGAFLGTLNTTNYTQSLVGGVVTQNTNSDSGNILRHAGLPDNYLVPDPQYSSVSVTQNPDNSTYHSLNVQFTSG